MSHADLWKYAFIVAVLAIVQGIVRAVERRASWVWVCRFAFRRAYKTRGAVPVGLPGHRDPTARCEAYSPVTKPDGTGECQTDGHYLCRGCGWISREALIERGLVQIEEPQ